MTMNSTGCDGFQSAAASTATRDSEKAPATTAIIFLIFPACGIR
jgi:hypothetical protein